ncbi:NAD(P)/FAD-dependent oxidoreductase [Maribacter antarcticus]|uniref:NAD(P)/FAD-dependent oxidoreductase n=1 Tax=Maribacter antarcticus TaxID=505250 RepID=UPI00047BCB35|nr:NAD(P)/FAD-dependent oxidoreductase [Maribacter antarcticus]
MKKEVKIAIVGAGVSGLIAAQVLEFRGYSPSIYEASDRAGGRVKTDVVNGYQLDHGFQVLLDAYPVARNYLDYTALDLTKFLPGATLFKNGRQVTLGDPLRNLSLLLPTLSSGIGTFGDKWKIFKLNRELKNKAIESIFRETEISTLDYLKVKGFSDEIIKDFFQPFFSGIFLEPNLDTSSRMFQFVYKMFGTGSAVLPKAGIEAIPKQLVSKLSKTNFVYNTKIESCTDGKLIFKDGSKVLVDYTIIATEASHLVPNLRNQEQPWKSCETLYFTTKTKIIKKPLIGLITDTDALINNIFYHSSLPMVNSGEENLLSITVVKSHQMSEEELVKAVRAELASLCSINDITFLKRYHIKRALPELSNIQYDMAPSETRLTSKTFLAGDQLLNGSLNAAMLSGERAANAVIEAINESIVS